MKRNKRNKIQNLEEFMSDFVGRGICAGLVQTYTLDELEEDIYLYEDMLRTDIKNNDKTSVQMTRWRLQQLKEKKRAVLEMMNKPIIKEDAVA